MPNPSSQGDRTLPSYANQLRNFLGDLEMLTNDPLTANQRERLGIALHELEMLARELEGEG